MARPRTFDLDVALDSALQLFWARGYEGTSVNDLTLAMGINKPSLYAAFGNKEALFTRVLDRYAEGPGKRVTQALQAATGREAVELLLRVYADGAGRTTGANGCLLVQGALACGDESATVRKSLAERRLAGELALRSRLVKAKKDGELPADSSPADLARYFWSVCYGMSVMAAGGATRAEMLRLVTQTLRGWPG